MSRENHRELCIALVTAHRSRDVESFETVMAQVDPRELYPFISELCGLVSVLLEERGDADKSLRSFGLRLQMERQ